MPRGDELFLSYVFLGFEFSGCYSGRYGHWDGCRPPQRVDDQHLPTYLEVRPLGQMIFFFSLRCLVAAGGDELPQQKKVPPVLARGSPLLGSSGTLFCARRYTLSGAPPSLAHVHLPRARRQDGSSIE